MAYLIPSLASLLDLFRPCFRQEAFLNFKHAVAAWLVCLGKRTLSEVAQAGGVPCGKHHDCLWHLFSEAAWKPSLHEILALRLVRRFAASGRIWVAVDDTLCRKRGACVAFGGIFLDAVLSSKRHKTFRFGVNQVVLGIAVRLPWLPNRFVCLPVFCELFRKKGAQAHQKKPAVAAELAKRFAALFPDRDVCMVGDCAYVNAATLRGRPANLHVVGPMHPQAALWTPPAPSEGRKRGRPRQRGERLPTPKEMLEDTERFEARTSWHVLPGKRKRLRTQDVRGALWWTAGREEPLRVVLVRDPQKEEEGRWRDLALACTDPAMSVAEVVEGYCRRWSIEPMFHDCKQHLGLSDPMVRTEQGVQRAHAMAYFCFSLAVLWYAENEEEAEAPKRDRPWYPEKRRPGTAFTEMLGSLRLALWRGRVFGQADAHEGKQPTWEMVDSLLNRLAAVQ